MIKRFINIIILFLVSSVMMAQTLEQDIYWRALNYSDNNQKQLAWELLKTQPDCLECTKLAADICYNNDDSFEAIKLYKEIVRYEPSFAYFMLSVVYAGMGFTEESIAYLTKHFESSNPKYYSEILSYDEFDEISNSQEWKEFWSEDRYSEYDLKIEEAQYLMKIEDYNTALSILESLSYRSKREYIYYLIASVYSEYKNYTEALQYLNLAIEYDKDFVKALILKRDIELINESYEAALLTNAQLLSCEPLNSGHLYMQAEILLKNNQSIEAEEYIDLYLKYFPNDEQANHLKTQILSGGEDYRKALINLNLLIDQNPSQAEYFVDRADIYYKLESWRFASADYSMALDIDPTSDHAWYHYGMCQYNLNNNKKACNAWQKAANMKNREAADMLFEFCE